MNKLIAISLTQPWATLVVHGFKRVETRSWPTRYSGPVLIHASKGFPKWAKDECAAAPFAATLESIGVKSWADLPTGAILGGTTIVECRSTNTNTVFAGLSESQRSIEPAFGDYSEDRYGWLLRESWRFRTPVPCRGSLSLWGVPDEVALLLDAAEPTVPNCFWCDGKGMTETKTGYAECGWCGGQGWRKEATFRGKQ